MLLTISKDTGIMKGIKPLATIRSMSFAGVGTFQNAPSLVTAIRDYIDNHNQHPQVFVWTAPAEQILAKVAKSKEVLDALH